jgi:hypothetical protein
MTTVAGLLTAVPGDDYLMFYSHTTTSDTTPPLDKRNIEIAEFDGDGSFDDVSRRMSPRGWIHRMERRQL